MDEPMNKDAQVVDVKSADAGSFFRAQDIVSWTDRDLEAALTATNQFSRGAVKALVSRLREAEAERVADQVPDTVFSSVLDELNSFSKMINGNG